MPPPETTASNVPAQNDQSSVIGSDDEAIATTLPDGTVFPGTAGIFVRFHTSPQKLPPNVTVTITPTIGDDTYPPIVVRNGNSSPVWQVSSSKYIDDSEFSYTITVEVDDPAAKEPPIIYSSAAPTKAAVPQGSIKFIQLLMVHLPTPPPDKLATIQGGFGLKQEHKAASLANSPLPRHEPPDRRQQLTAPHNFVEEPILAIGKRPSPDNQCTNSRQQQGVPT